MKNHRYLVQLNATDPGKWSTQSAPTPVQAAVYAAVGAGVMGEHVVHVAAAAGPRHPNGAPVAVHAITVKVTGNPSA